MDSMNRLQAFLSEEISTLNRKPVGMWFREGRMFHKDYILFYIRRTIATVGGRTRRILEVSNILSSLASLTIILQTLEDRNPEPVIVVLPAPTQSREFFLERGYKEGDGYFYQQRSANE